eukprot:7391260-Prymnesium_polylepis.1
MAVRGVARAHVVATGLSRRLIPSTACPDRHGPGDAGRVAGTSRSPAAGKHYLRTSLIYDCRSFKVTSYYR